LSYTDIDPTEDGVVHFPAETEEGEIVTIVRKTTEDGITVMEAEDGTKYVESAGPALTVKPADQDDPEVAEAPANPGEAPRESVDGNTFPSERDDD
jgi:hypothetical protein